MFNKKKILASILSFCLLFSMSIPVFADGRDDTVKVDDFTTEYYISHKTLDKKSTQGGIAGAIAGFIPVAGKFIAAGLSISIATLKLNDNGDGVIIIKKKLPQPPRGVSMICPQFSITVRAQ